MRPSKKEVEDVLRTESLRIVPKKALMDVEMGPGQSASLRKEKVEIIHPDHQVLTLGDTHQEPKVLTVEAIHREPRALTGADQHMFNAHQMVTPRPDPL